MSSLKNTRKIISRDEMPASSRASSSSSPEAHPAPNLFLPVFSHQQGGCLLGASWLVLSGGQRPPASPSPPRLSILQVSANKSHIYLWALVLLSFLPIRHRSLLPSPKNHLSPDRRPRLHHSIPHRLVTPNMNISIRFFSSDIDPSLPLTKNIPKNHPSPD